MGLRSKSTGIEKVPVKKVELLAKLKENKNKHEEEWKTAHVAYQKEWVAYAKRQAARITKMLERAEEAIEAEGLVRFPDHVFHVNLPNPPENHVRDYEMAIDLIGAMQTEQTHDGKTVDRGIIVLSLGDFNNFWRDDWDWQRSFQVSLMNSAPPASGNDSVRDLEF
jgi:hypothetical protein